MSFRRISKKTLQRGKSGRQSCGIDETYYCRLVQTVKRVSMAALCSSGWQWSCGPGTRFLWALGFRPPGCCGPVPPSGFLATRSWREAQQKSHCNVTSLPSEGLSKKLVLGFDYHSFDYKNYFSLNSKFVLRKCLLKNDKQYSSSKIAFTVRVKTGKSTIIIQKNLSVGLLLFTFFLLPLKTGKVK